MGKVDLIAMLQRFDAQSQEMHDAARQWMLQAKTLREREFANALMRHAKGAQVAVVAGRYEVEVAQE